MSDDSRTTHWDKPEQGDKFIPPPMDPYATYQTPYERHKSPEPNPFIEFRRFADRHISDIFAGFSNFTSFPQNVDHDEQIREQMRELRETFKERHENNKQRFNQIAAQRESLERESSKTFDDFSHHPIPPSATAAVLPTPPQSKDRRNLELGSVDKQKTPEDSLQGWITTTDDKGKKYCIDLSTGHATEQPTPTLLTPKSQQHEDARTRWRRGFKNCPELKGYQGETELDIYEAFEDRQRSIESTQPSTEGKPSWSSWISAYGWDGIQKSKNGSDVIKAESTLPDKCKVKQFQAGQTRQMDPLKNDHEFIPWMVLSPYSPLSLANPEFGKPESAMLHDGCHGGCTGSIRLFDHQYQDQRSISEEHSKLRDTFADKVPWADAFEDLMSLEKTGRMPDRKTEGDIQPKSTTSIWLRDMVENGILGPKWWVENGEIKRDSRNDPKPLETRSQKEIIEEMDKVFGDGLLKKINMFLPILEFVVQSLEKGQKASISSPQAVQLSKESNETSQLTVPENYVSLMQPESQANTTMSSEPLSGVLEVSPVPPQSKQQPAEISTPKRSVISTLTTTSTRTMPDGSVETKRVLKQRFADGNEESEESVETVHPQMPESMNRKQHLERQKNQGWFWT